MTVMFCSSLRQRKDWAPVVPELSRRTCSGWKGESKAKQDPLSSKAEADANYSPETTLDGYDVSFALAPQSEHRQSFFKLLLLSSAEAKTAVARARIERLSMLDGGWNVAVMMLLEQSGRVDSLVDLQLSIVTHGMASVPIIPMSSAAELVGRLDALRRQCVQAHAASVSHGSRADEVAMMRGLASRCVHGQALPQEHVDILTDVSAGLGSLARLVFSEEGQRRICDLLGDAQGGRVISFFTHGHEADRRLGIWRQDRASNGEANRPAEIRFK